MSRAGPGLLLLALATAPGPALAQASCDALDPVTPEVSVEVEPAGEPAIEPASEARLRGAAQAGGLHEERDRTVRGLTLNEFTGEVRSTMLRADLPGGQRCVALKSVRATIGNRRPRILIEERYAQGSCQYEAILAHEREHVRINEEALAEAERRLRQALQATAETWEGQWVPPDRSDAISRELEQTLNDVFAGIDARASREHAAIDAPAAYDAVQAKCESW